MSRIHEALKQASQKQHEPAPLADLSKSPIPTGSEQRTAGDWLELGQSPLKNTTASSPSPVIFGGGLNDLWKICSKQSWKFDPAYSVFGGTAPSPGCSEQFRKLRSKLYQIRASEPVHTVLVTSTISGEGKTFVALNLASAITRQHGRRVLLIDADLRAPKLSSCLGVPASPGLTEFLCGAADETTIVQTDTEGALFFVAAGNLATNPGELLGNERLPWLLKRLSPLFDWVIVDAPPVLPVSDVSVLAGYCDGLMMVVKAGATAYDAIGTALQELRGKKLLGVVLNRADEHGSYDPYPYAYSSEAEQLA